MAEAWARALRSDQIDPYSAGVEPHGMNPRAIKVMQECGVAMNGHYSKHIDSLAGIHFDYVVTVCDHAHETCPVFPGQTTRVHVGFDDPPKLVKPTDSEQNALHPYRRVRDQIKSYILTLPDSLLNHEETLR